MWKWIPAPLGVVALALVIFVIRVSTPAGAATGLCGTTNAPITPSENQLFQSINAWRAAELGAPAMKLSGTASKAAQWFAEEMVIGRTGGHMDNFGRSFNQRLKDCGYDSYWADASGEALAGFGSSNAAIGSTPAEALALMTADTPGHSNGLQAPVAWQCVGIGFATNAGATVGQLRYAWVAVVAQLGTANCDPAVIDQGGPPPSATATPTKTPTKTPTPSPTPSATPPIVHNHPLALSPAGWVFVVLPQGSLNSVLGRARGCYSAVYQLQGESWLRYSPDIPAYARTLTQSNGGVFWISGSGKDCGTIIL